MALNARQVGYAALSALSPFFRVFSPGYLRVLAYHGVPDKTTYSRQLSFLRRNYTIISLDDLLFAVRNEQQLPPKSVLLTFDDGEHSLFTNALPLHRELDIPAVIFVITSLIGTERPFWWKQVEQHYASANRPHREARDKVAELKKVSNAEREAYLDSLPPYFQQQLSLEELEALSAARFALANHTHSHPLANKCTPAELAEEVKQAQAFLSRVDGGYPDVFAYPNGNSSPESQQVLQQAGVELAFAFDHALTDLSADPLALSRIRVNTTDSIREFRAKVDGLHPFLFQHAKF